MIKLVVFDFDCTILDSFDRQHDIGQELLIKYKLPFTMSRQELRKTSFREILTKHKVPKWKMYFMYRKGKSAYKKSIHDQELVAGIEKEFRFLEKNYKMAIVSSSNVDISQILKSKNILMFDPIVKGLPMGKKSKHIAKLAKQFNVDLSEIAYVGDEVRDIVASHKAGVHSIAVTWGFNDEATLKSVGPSAVVSKPSQLRKAIKEL